MTDMLPPAREVPPRTRARVRAELERAVAGRRRRLLVPVLAAGAVAVVAAGVVLFRPEPVDPTPAVEITADPPEVAETFGLSREQIAEVERGCADAAGEADEVTLHNYGADAAGRWALLYTANAVLWCDIGRDGTSRATRQGVLVDWLAGNFSTDTGGAAVGVAGSPGVRVLAGRVDSSVARMTYRRSDGEVGEVTIANGTFVMRSLLPPTWNGGGGESVTSELAAYGADGARLDPDSDSPRKCWTVPGTDEVLPDRRPIGMVETPAMKCQPAPRWK